MKGEIDLLFPCIFEFARMLMKTIPLFFFLLMSLAASAQGQRQVHRYVLDWSSKTGQMTVTHRDEPQRRRQVIDARDLDVQSLTRVLDVPANSKALLYIHCWLGETRFFHWRSMGWLTAEEPFRKVGFVIGLALFVPWVVRTYFPRSQPVPVSGFD